MTRIAWIALATAAVIAIGGGFIVLGAREYVNDGRCRSMVGDYSGWLGGDECSGAVVHKGGLWQGLLPER